MNKLPCIIFSLHSIHEVPVNDFADILRFLKSLGLTKIALGIHPSLFAQSHKRLVDINNIYNDSWEPFLEFASRTPDLHTLDRELALYHNDFEKPPIGIFGNKNQFSPGLSKWSESNHISCISDPEHVIHLPKKAKIRAPILPHKLERFAGTMGGSHRLLDLANHSLQFDYLRISFQAKTLLKKSVQTILTEHLEKYLTVRTQLLHSQLSETFFTENSI